MLFSTCTVALERVLWIVLYHLFMHFGCSSIPMNYKYDITNYSIYTSWDIRISFNCVCLEEPLKFQVFDVQCHRSALSRQLNMVRTFFSKLLTVLKTSRAKHISLWSPVKTFQYYFCKSVGVKIKFEFSQGKFCKQWGSKAQIQSWTHMDVTFVSDTFFLWQEVLCRTNTQF